MAPSNGRASSRTIHSSSSSTSAFSQPQSGDHRSSLSVEFVVQSVVCFFVFYFVQLYVQWQKQQHKQQQHQQLTETAQESTTCPAPLANHTAENPQSDQLSLHPVKSTSPKFIMSEDRHNLSEPRLVPPGSAEAHAFVAEARLLLGDGKVSANYVGPVFVVDVYRSGVDDPVDTVVVTDETLPPRKNRKGKIAWRLPDLEAAKGGRLPNFGSDEKKRIFDLFKERKKNRKKLLKRGSSLGGDGMPGSPIREAAAAAAAVESMASPSTTGNGQNQDKSTHSVNTAASTPSPAGNDASPTNQSAGWSRGRIRAENEMPSASDADVPELVAAVRASKLSEGSAPGSGSGSGSITAESTSSTGSSAPETKKKVSKREKKHGKTKSKNGNGDSDGREMTQQSDDGFAPGTPPGLPAATVPTNDTQQGAASTVMPPSGGDNSASTSTLALDLPPMKSIVVPEPDRPQPNVLDPNPSMSVPAAKTFIDLYYPLISNGMSDELTMHYAPKAQKSVTVGSAHLVVANRDEIQAQLNDFGGSQFAPKSVVAQDSADAGGAHILISGMIQHQGIISAFAHSVSLVPAAKYGCSGAPDASFLIHNDAFMLLKGPDPPAPVQPPQVPISAPLGTGIGAGPGLPSGLGAAPPPGMAFTQQQQPLGGAPLPPGFQGRGF